MPREIRFQFPLPNGLHARPASHVQELANRFSSQIQFTNTRNGRKANAKSVLSMVSTDVRQNDACVIQISGDDEDSAEAELARFIRDVLPTCDDEIAPAQASADEQPLPRSLRAAGLQEYDRGTPVSGGIGVGKVVRPRGRTTPSGASEGAAADPDRERSRFDAARRSVHSAIESRVVSSKNRNEIGVLRAHAAILDDAALIDHVRNAIDRDAQSAAAAVRAACDFFAATLRASESAYLRERALDVQDVADQLMDALDGARAAGATAATLEVPSIVVADRLTPSEFLALNRNHLRGLVLREAGTTSHTVILARSINVPTIVGAAEASMRLRNGQEIIVDANLGIVIPEITDSLRRYYEREQSTLAAMEARADLDPCQSVFEISANVSSAEEVELAMERGADGVGLFRTEMLFLDRAAPPSEDEQFEIYARAARALNGKPLTIRLLDVGGDKPAPYLNLPREANPFLGFRGARIYPQHAELIRTQIRAIERAVAESSNVRILVPMIASVEEMRAVRAMVPASLKLGAMIEIPSCAFMMEELAAESDFFSIGSNDLVQYFLAADRDNASVAHVYSWTHPSFLRMLAKIVSRARVDGRSISLCGEMADDPRAWPILVALPLDEISVPAPRIATVRRAIGKLRVEDCAGLLAESLACATRGEVETLLDRFSSARTDLPLLDRALIIRSDAISKHELIKEMTDALWLADRAANRFAIEEAVWRREETYSTGFGHGFALPHCKSDQVIANSIVVAKLTQPVDWGSSDGQPVDVVLFVAMRESEYGKEHLRVFAQLSRMVMHDEFRDRVRTISDHDELLNFLKQNLGPGIT